MLTVEELLTRIEKFCAARQMAESTFGRLATGDGKFVKRLRNGGDLTTTVMQRVLDFMDHRRSA